MIFISKNSFIIVLETKKLFFICLQISIQNISTENSETEEIQKLNHSNIQKTSYNAIQSIDLNTSSRLTLILRSNEYCKMSDFTNEPNYAKTFRESCHVSYNDELFFYGGLNHSRRIFKLNSDSSEKPLSELKFDFVSGSCARNNDFVLLCFSVENKRLCYKSNSPVPDKWWKWFTYVEFAYTTHDSISLSSGNT